MRRIRLIASRATLLAVLVAALYGLWLVHFHGEHRLWPLPHDTRLLLFIVVYLAWAAVVLAALVVVCKVLARLWRWAEL